ncbi:RnfABCDGE type electron transport complex subunit D [Sporomusa acidovorans]|uniref:Ion-translocating oxidoreductase complex subunit D n=1 Tax=Sporomusa acidovorans (strain ATCC 49682 / DSM 3132 / Mol) TaxID=1123286 RepID=A0ABZ3J0P9_SPOA4|nr:RnfABCDGE type electron transport complex subunit D [Sporomusa acidovorans]OZC22496.1 electron transport complex subunit RsxD [Sporomusa acidovorans DSM 3132]SDE73593.1 electron transport complex protein RnfD [Sporomusa acidovorans]
MSAEVKLDVGTLTVSASPHIRCDESIAKIMWAVNLALAPAALFSVYRFGMPALTTMILCIAVAVATEYLIQKWQNKPITINDGSAFLTGLLLAMNIPATLPWYMPVFGTVVAIAVAKHTMGGLGYNIFNPALVGRAVLLASWPVAMTTWPQMASKIDGVTSATPLGILKLQGYEKLVEIFGDKVTMYQSLFVGSRSGSMGETSALLLILGGLFLIYRGYINWQIPVCMIGTVGVLTAVFGQDPIMHMMSGGLILGAFFMATDMVTIPITIKGQIIFAIGAGMLTVLIRLLGGYPEGVCYAILLMNCVTPLIDLWIKPAKFGARR